jgi:hypothetical protein
MISQILETLKDRISTDEKLTLEKKAELRELVEKLAEGLGTLPAGEREAIKTELQAQAAGETLQKMAAGLMPKLEAFGGLSGLAELADDKGSDDEPGKKPEDDAPVAALVRKINDTLLRFETAHPTLTAHTNRLADLLASVGI